MTTYTIGQRLWYVPERGISRWIAVEKIGRAYLHTDIGRFDLSTLEQRGGWVGKAYLSKEARDEEVALQDRWRAFAWKIDRTYSAPAGVTVHDIEAAATRLGLTLEGNLP